MNPQWIIDVFEFRGFRERSRRINVVGAVRQKQFRVSGVITIQTVHALKHLQFHVRSPEIKEGISKENFQKLKDASLKIFPKLELFNGWGIYAQNFEGQILKNVMLEGVKEGIVCLPVHDAVAVPLDNIGWACEEMRCQWDKQMSVSGLARVTTDIPA